jgi:uncharacterized protein (TIGR02996 family)
VNDPAAPFWSAIEAAPHEPGPRLIFADWCDDNRFPVMGDVQRWLAATGRHSGWPSFFSPQSGRRWWCLKSQPWTRLPAELREALPPGPDRPDRMYDGDRGAEEALAVAWLAVTRLSHWWEFWRKPWVPNYDRVWEPHWDKKDPRYRTTPDWVWVNAR